MENENAKKKKPSGCLIALFVLLFFVAALAGGAYAVFQHYMGKTNYEEIDLNGTIELNPNYTEEETESGTNSPEDLIDQANKDLLDHINGGQEEESSTSDEEESVESTEAVETKPTVVANVEHILLIGADRRDQSWNGNSDTMILVTINHNTKKIILTSIMRDSYVYIQGVGNGKINAAYARGGAALLLATIQANLKVPVGQYATVDFNAFTSVIDTLGTIPITLKPEEITYMQDMLAGLHHEGNVYYLDGKTALNYARNRSVGRWDFERTERQRKVITAVFNQMKTLDLNQLNNMANAVLPYVTHNITSAQLLSWIMQSPQLLEYQLVSNRVPYDGMYQGLKINGQSVLVLDWTRNVNQLNKVLYE